MNILVLSPAIYPCTTGGVEIFNYYLTKELAKRGHKVWVITNCGYNWNNRNISVVKLNAKLLSNPVLQWHQHLRPLPWKHPLKHLPISPTMFHMFLELIVLRKQIDVIHVPYTSNSPLAYPVLLAKKFCARGIPYIITIHGGAMWPWRKPKTLHKLFFKYANSVVAVSQIIRKEYEKRSGRKIIVVTPLIPFIESKISKEELRKRYGFGNDDQIILSLGSINEIKGSDTLLYAFLDLGKNYIEKNNLKLLYVGEGPMKPILEGKVKERGFDGYVKFLGAIPHEEVPHLYKLADIYVISSLFEGAPKSLLEAMFNGLPIIGTDVNGINNLIRHGRNGLLFEKENMKDLTEKIKELVENKDLSNKLGKGAKKAYARTHDKFEYVVSKYIKLYEECVSKNE